MLTLNFIMAALSLALFILGVWLAWQGGRDRLAGILLCLGSLLTFSGGFNFVGTLLLPGILVLALGCGTLLSITI